MLSEASNKEWTAYTNVTTGASYQHFRFDGGYRDECYGTTTWFGEKGNFALINNRTFIAISDYAAGMWNYSRID